MPASSTSDVYTFICIYIVIFDVCWCFWYCHNSAVLADVCLTVHALLENGEGDRDQKYMEGQEEKRFKRDN